ncbi:uroporphyrinogen decarboxylase [Candidatus Endowatersipora endosymbiont of Watersipora subatra]|uniref:uroporphyrinogen decarboxylase n=1 Tax=Candidatus Endowatersipora endosymbiont of Watersipora subatra TaxID=3077946 RepID=UPI00312C86BD
MMRQAGRYLPEYRTIRNRSGAFLDLCYSPEKAVELTLQPIRRFGFDAAILFSDILVIPDALGIPVIFKEGQGPIIKPISIDEISLLKVDNVLSHLIPIFETLKELSIQLPSETTLLGFCGAPWTIATYMIVGHATPNQVPTRLFALEKTTVFQRLIDVITEASILYLVEQIKNGAEAVQIFDSWASLLDQDQMNRWCIEPVRRIVEGVRYHVPHAKIIGFPKGIGAYYKDYRRLTGVNMVSLDWGLPLSFAQEIQKKGPVQGNLDPLRLIAGGKVLNDGVDMILESLSSGPLVFNLGHGIMPNTPIDHVESMIKRVRDFKGN